MLIYSYSDLMNLCNNTNSASQCEVNVEAVNYISYNTLEPLRILQDKCSQQLENDINNLSAQGAQTLYILVACCIAVVFVSISLIIPVFIWVIKDKSHVIAIFADVTDEEIREIIKVTGNFDIRSIKYRRQWLSYDQGDEDKFWDRVLRKHNERKRRPKELLRADSATPQRPGTSTRGGEIASSEKPLQKSADLGQTEKTPMPSKFVAEDSATSKGEEEENKKAKAKDSDSDPEKSAEQLAREAAITQQFRLEEQRREKQQHKRTILGMLE